jgi:hypothetical protein
MRNSPPELLPDGQRTRVELPPHGPRLRKRHPFWVMLSSLTVVGIFCCVGAVLGVLAGLWIGRACGYVRLGFSTGLTVGTLVGVIVAGFFVLPPDTRKRHE